MKKTIILLLMLMVVLTGCKKDEEVIEFYDDATQPQEHSRELPTDPDTLPLGEWISEDRSTYLVLGENFGMFYYDKEKQSMDESSFGYSFSGDNIILDGEYTYPYEYDGTTFTFQGKKYKKGTYSDWMGDTGIHMEEGE